MHLVLLIKLVKVVKDGRITRMAQTFRSYANSIICNTCQNGGKFIDKKPSGADSNGLIRKEEIIDLDIPAGVVDGMQLSVTGKKCRSF